MKCFEVEFRASPAITRRYWLWVKDAKTVLAGDESIFNSDGENSYVWTE